MSVVFIDVRGFTALAEQLPPDEVAHRLNRFYSLAANTIFNYDGTLDKLVGDQVMAFFGAPLYATDHAKRAVHAAFSILEGVNHFTHHDPLHVGAGIATGEAFVGNVGGGTVADYTVLGDTVNIAARLQAAAASGEILLTEETYSYVQAEFPRAPRREMELKGKTEHVHARVIVVDKRPPERAQDVRP